jgi:hypothetical protein
MRPSTAHKKHRSKAKENEMKDKDARHVPTALRLLLAVVMATCVFTAAANAQPSFAGKFTLPYEVHWGLAVLPAGNYFIRMESTAGVAVISSAKGDRTVYTEFPTIADNEPGNTCLTITTDGNERRVRSLNLPQLRKLVIFAPLTKSERETLAKAGNVKTVPVVTAEK